MNARRPLKRSRYLVLIFPLFVCGCVLSLLGFGYRATKEWQRSSELLMTREVEDSSALLVTALVRDMQSVQSRVLANRDWSESSISLADTSTQVASTFARYPYPESFFVWRADDGHVTFFHRADRYPGWKQADGRTSAHPVVIDIDPDEALALRRQIDTYASIRVRYVGLDTTLKGQPYQVIARLTYGDSAQSRLQSVTGYTVNLTWVRRSYFADFLPQLLPIATRGAGLAVWVADDHGVQVWGDHDGPPQIVREFPLLFLDPTLGRVMLAPDSKLKMWTIAVGRSRTSPLQLATEGADETLLVAGTAAFVLCLGMVLSVRAVQDRATLAEMRSEFVSSVTHELKMPL